MGERQEACEFGLKKILKYLPKRLESSLRGMPLLPYACSGDHVVWGGHAAGGSWQGRCLDDRQRAQHEPCTPQLSTPCDPRGVDDSEQSTPVAESLLAMAASPPARKYRIWGEGCE